MTRRLFDIVGRRACLAFGFVSFLVAALLATVSLTSRHALKQYVEYQLGRIPWDVALYQRGPAGGEDTLRRFVERTPGVTDVATLAFLRARFPEGGEVQAKVDRTPLNTPWLSVLAASDLSLLPPQLGFALSSDGGAGQEQGAVLALVGPEFAIGKAFLGLQGGRRFTLEVASPDGMQAVFETPLRQVVRLERDELNRWLMDQTGSVSYIPVIGAILLMPYDWGVLTKFDFVANGIVPGDLTGSLSSDQIHVQQAEYAPELVYLARVNRGRLISGWDISGSLDQIATLNAALHSGAADSAPQPAAASTAHDAAHHEEEVGEDPHPEKFGGLSYVVDSTTEVLLGRMQAIARLVGLVSLLAALPLLWMAWMLGANLAALLTLNERRTLGLLRLRGVPGAVLGRVLLASVAAGGFVGGLVGLVVGSVGSLLVYEGGDLPLDVLIDPRQMFMFGVFLLVSVAMALLVCRRLVRYATTISPLEATVRVSNSEAMSVSMSAGPLQVMALAAGGYVLCSWIFGFSLAGRLGLGRFRPIEQLFSFVGLPLFVYGVATLMASNPDRVQRVMAPVLGPIGGVLGRFALRHLAVKPHRAVAFLFIVALMSSVSLYPVITGASFEEKAARGARVQIGADWQVLYNTPDLVDASLLTGPATQQIGAMKPALDRLMASLRGVDGVEAATYLLEGLLPNFYLPGYGLRGVPIYLFGEVDGYARGVYAEPRVGISEDFDRLVARVRAGEIALSEPVADFWQLSPGNSMVVGLDRSRRAVEATAAGVLAFLPGMPPQTVSDRQGYVQARIDYLNYLLASNAYLVARADHDRLAEIDLLIPRIVVLLRTNRALDPVQFRTMVSGAAALPPMEIHSLEDEVQKVGSDMYISLALANMRIYLLGGLILALVSILAIALVNYADDRRTLALLRIRGASPAALFRFVLATLLAPALVGLAIGAASAVIAGFGLASYVWQLREIRGVVQLLPTHLVIAPLVAGLVLLLVTWLVAVASGFSWWAFRDTAHQSIRGT